MTNFFIEKNEKYYLGEEILRGANKIIINNLSSTTAFFNHSYPSLAYSANTSSINTNFTKIPSSPPTRGDVVWDRWRVIDIWEESQSYLVTLSKSGSILPHMTKILISKYPLSPDEGNPIFKKILNPNDLLKGLVS